MKNKVMLIVISGILLVAVLVFSSHAFTWGNKFKKEADKEKLAVKLVREVQRGGYKVITAQELKNWLDQGKDMLLIDTMPCEASYKKAHIPGAKQFDFPIPEMPKWDQTKTKGKTIDDYKKLLGNDTNRTIVVYCGFVKCTRSHNGAMWAVRLGYKNVFRFPGGIYAWKGLNFPTEKVQ